MREESHLDDMRSAIRGDFERLAERLGEQELLRPQEERDEVPGPLDDDRREPEPEPEAELDAEHDEEARALSEDTPSEPQRRSFLDRLLGR